MCIIYVPPTGHSTLGLEGKEVRVKEERHAEEKKRCYSGDRSLYCDILLENAWMTLVTNNSVTACMHACHLFHSLI